MLAAVSVASVSAPTLKSTLCSGWRRPPLLLRLHLHRPWDRRVVVAVVGHGDQPRGAVGGNEERLRARAEHAIPALQLGAVDGEVGLVDQLVRVGAVLRIAGDADRDGRADRLAG